MFSQSLSSMIGIHNALTSVLIYCLAYPVSAGENIATVGAGKFGLNTFTSAYLL